MKVLLCSIPLGRGKPKSNDPLPIIPKVAIVSIISWMEKSGYTAETYDFFDIDMLDSSDDEIREYLKKSQPTVLGLSAIVSTTYACVKKIAAIAREVSPQSWIVLGGNLAASANILLRKTDVDVCIQGDGEISFVEFLRYVEKYQRTKNCSELAKIKGLSYLDENENFRMNGYGDAIPDEEVPYPDYEILKLGLKDKEHLLNNYFSNALRSVFFSHDQRAYEKNRKPKVASLWISKGCVARCTFCQRGSRKLHRFSIEKLDHHLKMLVTQFDVGFISVMDENFGADKKHTYEVAKLMKKYNLIWMCGGVRCLNITEQDLRFYLDCGCCALKFGVESGSQKILDIMEKRFSTDDVRKAIILCANTGIYSPIAVMVGMPGETNQTVVETGKLVGELAAIQGLPFLELDRELCIFYALPLPGTPLYQYGQKIGIIGNSVDEEEKYLESVTDRGPEKKNYVNLNGASTKDIIFWNIMLKLEAYRAWYKTHKKLSRETSNSNKQQKKSKYTGLQQYSKLRQIITPFVSGIKAWKNRPLLEIIKQPKIGVLSTYHIMLNMFLSSRFIACLPRKPLYFMLKNIIYINFLFRKFILQKYASLDEFSLYRSRKKDSRLPLITDAQLASLDRPGGSLRDILKAIDRVKLIE